MASPLPALQAGSPSARAGLRIDAPAVVEQIADTIRTQVLGSLRRQGVVVGLSGGIDSSVVAALCARALGRDRVLGLLLPERASAPESLELGRLVASALGIETALEDLSPALEALGCYRRQAEAVRMAFPEYQDGWRFKLALPPLAERDRLNVFGLVVERPDGTLERRRLSVHAYLGLVAATNLKQRARALMLYHHAERRNRAVAGTPNRLEYDQGFFVKHGDGAADLKPIAHLYKTQVYALAEHLGIPEAIRRRPPTTDTYSLAQTQEEFYFALPWHQMDLCLYGLNHQLAAAAVAAEAGLTEQQVERVYRDIDAKRRSTRALHQPPLLVQEVSEV
jgi:NAD+ synthase